METIRAYTTIEQSRKLAEILPLESADMMWEQHYNNEPYVTIKPWTTKGKSIGCNCLSCWSLAALLGVLPKATNISTPDPLDKIRYSCWNDYDITYADNPVDACVAMIEKLNELNLL